MLRISFCLALASASLCLAGVVVPTAPQCGYESCHPIKKGFLNVHLVPHTHDDVGWLKTVDQYYYGSHNDIQKAGVQYILDSVVKELWEKPDRRFIYVETAFFWKWWTHQSDDVRHKVHVLVREGRLQFVGGAWSMNDEAAVHYQTTIDQFTWGLKKLNETFGACGIPRVGWQIDPFGHSREFASLLAQMGYDGLFLGRIDFQDKSRRLKTSSMEMLWRGDDVLGKSSDLFTGVLYNTYSPPPGFCFDVLCNDEPIIDDVNSPIYNVDRRVNHFLQDTRTMARAYKTNNILVTMGDDFNYQDAAMWYKNIDKLIEHANLKAAKEGLNITLLYSTPDCYLKAVKDANPTLPTKQDDFFPYASDRHAFWTGYFTSRPTTKYFEREGNNYLQMAKQLQVLANLDEHNMFMLNDLKSAMGVMQHHDAVTGTEKQRVAHDYERILDLAIQGAMIIPWEAINKLTQGEDTSTPLLNMERCRLNESSCYSAERYDSLVVTLYNPLGWEVSEPIRIPVVAEAGDTYQVYDPLGKIIESQMLTIRDAVKNIPTRIGKANYEVLIKPTLPPVGYTSYYLKKTASRTKRDTKKKHNRDESIIYNTYWDTIKHENSVVFIPDAKSSKFDIEYDVLNDKAGSANAEEFKRVVEEDRGVESERQRERAVFPKLNEEEMRMLSDEPQVVEMISDSVTELDPVEVSVGDSGISYRDSEMTINIGFYYYPGCVGNNMGELNRSSGAYIFRPNATEPKKVDVKLDEYVSGDIVKETRVSGDNFASTLRAYDGYFEIDTVVGPIDIADGVGKEYIARYSTNIVNNGAFYTDSNARQLLKRQLDKRPEWNLILEEHVAGNYYPVSNFISIQDGGQRFAVVTDRSEGGTSLVEGQIELMLHRRLLHDDAFGVGEALNETADGKGLVTRITHRGIINRSDLNLRKVALQVSLHPTVFVSHAEKISLDDWLKLKNQHSFLRKPLPDGVHLLTLEPWRHGSLLIRFENINEAPTSLYVDMSDLFKNIKVKSYRETTLAANMYLGDRMKWRWNTEKDFARSFNEMYGSFNQVPATDDFDLYNDDNGAKINLKSKQIRTFIVQYDYI
ncbi:lysosomal alpha-mannosidase-like isoform X3 [Plodia interpunctella]|uniref:lysosomal alpha-mannosidase-like isoform X3 n=1 Tax=Plodia interpunctella TaxID=58824 RepID=UPI00236747B7|nr:lysosomal alpha-mannosidase-like isoform X3 [Plodia interpunctella]